MRTIKMNFSESDVTRLVERINEISLIAREKVLDEFSVCDDSATKKELMKRYRTIPSTAYAMIQTAIGRHTQWGLFINTPDLQIAASYSDTSGKKYFIMAVYRPDTFEFTFHS